MCKGFKKWFKDRNRWLNKNEHLTQWIIAFATLVVAIPIIYGWISLKVPFPSFPLYQNPISCTHPINASCVCDYRDKNGYLKFKEEKCKNLKIGRSIDLTAEEISQVSQYFSVVQYGQLARFTITNNSDMCIENGSCNYIVTISDNTKVIG